MPIDPFEATSSTPEAKSSFDSLSGTSALVKGRSWHDANNSKLLSIVGSHEFIAMKLPARETIMAPWLMTQSLNMIYGWRGVGKTHISLGISFAVASGGEFLHWRVGKPRRVLLIDGEMPAATLQKRLVTNMDSCKVKPEPGFLEIVTPDLQKGAMPDLSTSKGQEVINEAIERSNAELVIVDNLSCLVRGNGRENDAESWLSVSEWALLQRQAGRSIIFIHHSGKNGQQRGTSKREDLLDVVIFLKRPNDRDPSVGACIEIHYEKARHLSGSDIDPIEAQLSIEENGQSSWSWRSVSETNFDRVVNLANEGLGQREIADELGLNRSTVCRAWHKANTQGLLIRKTSLRGRNQYQK